MQNLYKKNFLNKVILRLDFIDTLLSVNDSFPEQLRQIILEDFKTLDEQNQIHRNLHVDANKGEVKKEDSIKKTFKFFSLDRKKSLTILENSIYFELDSYEGFEKTKNMFIKVIDAFRNDYPNMQISRFGIRFINNINLESKLIKSGWSKYLNKTLLQENFTKLIENGRVIRTLGLLEFRYEDLVNVRFQYGIPNKDYPAPIADSVFLLDYDASLNFVQNFEEVRQNFEKAHSKIKEIFEYSITDKLREIMNG